MAIPAARLIQDENLDILFTGGAILGEKTDGSKAQKEGGGLGSRKDLNDISNSTNPSASPVSKKHSSNNVMDKNWFLVDLDGLDDQEFTIEHEGFLYGRNKIMDKNRFLEEMGLDDEPPFLPLASELRVSPIKSGLLFEPDSPDCLSPLSPWLSSACSSPLFPGLSYDGLSPPRLSSDFWNSDQEDNLPDPVLSLIESPKHPKAGSII